MKPRPRPFSVTRKYKRFLAFGCSHGELADPEALGAVLRFKERWKPDTTLHLGDAIDLGAFRSGAKGSADESRPIAPDFDSGLQFIRDIRPQWYLMGNHEDRLWRLQHHPNAITAELSSKLVAEIEATCKQLQCRMLPYKYKQGIELGDYLFMHGTIFTENAARDTAEVCGSAHRGVVCAHAHRASVATARNWTGTIGYCAGHLMRPELAEYAKARKSTYAWAAGFVWGEYIEGGNTVAWLHCQPQGSAEWRLPL